MDSKNITEKIETVEIVTGTSQKTGKPYDYLKITFKNGYSTPIFLRDDTMYIVKNIAAQGA